MQIIAPEIIILVEQRNLGIGPLFQHVFGIDLRFHPVAGLPAHGPREFARIGPFIRTGCQEQMRHAALIDVAMYGAVGWRAKLIEQEGHAVPFHQTAGLFQRARRLIGIIIDGEFNPPSADAALIIQALEHRFQAAGNHRIG